MRVGGMQSRQAAASLLPQCSFSFPLFYPIAISMALQQAFHNQNNPNRAVHPRTPNIAHRTTRHPPGIRPPRLPTSNHHPAGPPPENTTTKASLPPSLPSPLTHASHISMSSTLSGFTHHPLTIPFVLIVAAAAAAAAAAVDVEGVRAQDGSGEWDEDGSGELGGQLAPNDDGDTSGNGELPASAPSLPATPAPAASGPGDELARDDSDDASGLGTREPPRPEDGRVCAREGGTCACVGTVFYGMRSRWAQRTSTGTIGCNNGVFGDPYPGTGKECRCVDAPGQSQRARCRCPPPRLMLLPASHSHNHPSSPPTFVWNAA